jgi:hypothetical protein
LNFWIIDLGVLFVFCYLVTGFQLLSIFGLPKLGIMFKAHSPLTVAGAGAASLLILIWSLYRADRRGWWDDGPEWLRWFGYFLP